MTPPPRVSVVVVSRARPEALRRCLLSLSQLDYPAFEIVVAADDAGLSAVADMGLKNAVKAVAVAKPGVSLARNAALSVAVGDVVAFIDDDSVAESSWLTHLSAPFANPEVAAAGGFVRGRNGISFQWTARSVDRQGVHRALQVPVDAPSLHRGTPDCAIRTEGTNMALRRDVVLAMGGFDPAFEFYLDETDLNMRLAREGAVTAVVPRAQVHHRFAASAIRTSDRVPRDLFDIGASSALFLRKHAPQHLHSGALGNLRREQRKRLLTHMVSGALMPGDVAPLLRRLEDGIAEGQGRVIPALSPIAPAGAPFLRFQPRHSGNICLASRIWRAGRARATAAQRVSDGQRVTLFVFSPSARYHRMSFEEGGFWEQRGGLFGRSDRAAPLLQLARFRARVLQECARLKSVRELTHEGHNPVRNLQRSQEQRNH